MINVSHGSVNIMGDEPEVVLEACCLMSAVYQKLVKAVGDDVALEVFADMGRFAVAEMNSDEQEEVARDLSRKMLKAHAEKLKDMDVSDGLRELVDALVNATDE